MPRRLLLNCTLGERAERSDRVLDHFLRHDVRTAKENFAAEAAVAAQMGLVTGSKW